MGVIPGRAVRREPGIHKPRLWLWIPGPALTRRPGMTTVGSVSWNKGLLQIQPERHALVGHLAASDRIDRLDHAAVAAEHAVGERHDADIGRRGCRQPAQLA